MHAELVIHLVYDASTTTKEYVKERLSQAANYLANNGMLTGDGPAVVEEWRYQVSCEDEVK